MMSDGYFMNWQISAVPKPYETVCSKHPLRACMRAHAYTGETADGFAWFRTVIFCRFWILLSRITCPCAKTGLPWSRCWLTPGSSRRPRRSTARRQRPWPDRCHAPDGPLAARNRVGLVGGGCDGPGGTARGNARRGGAAEGAGPMWRGEAFERVGPGAACSRPSSVHSDDGLLPGAAC